MGIASSSLEAEVILIDDKVLGSEAIIPTPTVYAYLILKALSWKPVK